MKHSIHNAKITKFRSLAALIVLGSSMLLTACGDAESTAGNYLKNPPASSSNSEPTTTPPTTTPPATTPPTDTPPPAMPAASGDAAKGNALMVDCMACHNPTGLAKAVTLNAAAISRLDKAYKTSQVSFHSGFKATHFEGAGRLDLEAALKAINLK